MKRFLIRAPRDLSRFIAEKGSVSLDGTSLTVNQVEGDAFSILLIPHTLKVTTWEQKRPGDWRESGSGSDGALCGEVFTDGDAQRRGFDLVYGSGRRFKSHIS